MAIKPPSFGGGGGGGRLKATTGQSSADLERAMAIETNYRMLSEQFPSLKDTATLTSLANMSPDPEEVMRNAVAAVGEVELRQMLDDFKEMDDAAQRGEWENMPQAKRAIFERMGYETPGDGGWWSDVKGAVRKVPMAGGLLAGGMGAVGTVVGGVMTGMEEGAQFMGRFPRAGEARADQLETRKALEARGIDPDLFSERTGIRLGGGEPPALASWLANPIEGMFTGDYWSIWKGQGQEGEDDILASRMVEAYDILDAADEKTALEDFNVARMLAQGMKLNEIADELGFSVMDPGYQEWAKGVYTKWTTEGAFKDAFTKMAHGKMSYGRMTARQLGFTDAEIANRANPGAWVSGAFDAGYGILTDPTLIVGKFAKGAKLARTGIESVDDVDRFRGLWKASKLYEEGKRGDEIAGLLGKDPRNFFAVRHLSREADLLALGRKVGAPAERIAKAFQTKDWASLARDMPHVMPALDQMKAFHAGQLAKGEAGLDVAETVFDFYTHTAEMNRFARSGKDAARGMAIFGKDPHHLYMPAMNVGLLSKLRNASWYSNLALDGAKELPKGVQDSLVKLMDEEGVLSEQGLGALDIQLDRLGNWTEAKRGRARGFIHSFTTKVPKTQGFLNLGDTVTTSGLEEMRKFMEMGVLQGMPRETIDTYFNLAVNGNQAQRALVVNRFLEDIFSKAGILNDVDGKAWAQKFMNHNAQAYGVTDQIALGTGVGTKHAVLSRQVSAALSVPTFKEFVVATRKVNALRRVSGALNSGLIDAIMSRAWKPAQLMRMGFAARAGGEEALSFILRNGFKEYIQSSVAMPWAISGGELGAKAKLVPGLVEQYAKDPAHSTLLRPLTALSNTMMRMAGLTDDALETVARRKAGARLDFPTADFARQKEIIEEEAVRYANSGRVKAGIKHLDHMANVVSLWSSKWGHEVARGLHLPDRAAVGKWMLSKEREDLLTAAGMAVDSALFQDMLNESLTNSIVAGERPVHNTRADKNTLMEDPRRPNELIQVPLKKTGEWRWVTMDNPSEFINGAGIQLDHIANSVGGKEALREFTNYFDEAELAEVHRRMEGKGTTYAWWRATDPDAKAMDSLLSNDDWKVRKKAGRMYDRKIGEAARSGLTDVYGIRRIVADASDSDKAVLRVIARSNDPKDLNLVANLEDETIREIVGAFADNPRLRHVFDPDKKGRVHTTKEEVWEAAENRIYNAMRRLNSNDPSRRMVRAMSIDGKMVADAAEEGVETVFMPMFDRMEMPGIAAVLATPEGANAYAHLLSQNLSDLGFGREFTDAWMATPPSSSGWSVDEWMQSIKARQELGGGLYAPSALVASPNRKIAEAVRDAIADTLEALGQNPGSLKPTIGKLRFARDEVGESIVKGGGDNIYHVAPDKALRLEPMDPDDIHEMVMVQFEDGHAVTMSRAELNTVRAQHAVDGQGLSKEQLDAGWKGELDEGQGGLYKELKVWEANGLSEDTALRRAAQDAAFDMMRMTFGRKSDLPMTSLIDEMVHGEIDGFHVWANIDVSELPDRLYAPMRATPAMGKYERVVGGMTDAFFNRYATPMIRSLSHSPQLMWNVSKASKQMRFVFDNLANADLDTKARSILRRVGLDPDEFEAFNRYYLGRDAPLETDGPDGWMGLADAVEDRAGSMDDAVAELFGGEAPVTVRTYRRAESKAAMAAKKQEAGEELTQAELNDIANFRHMRRRVGDPDETMVSYEKSAMVAPDDNLREALSKQAAYVSDEELEVLKNWHRNQNAAWREWRDASLMRGYQLTIPFIDDSRIRSQFQEYIGPLLPFWYAEEQFLRRMARGVAQTPWMLRKAQLLMNGMASMGFVRTDDQGNRMFVWPGSEMAMSVVGAGAGLVFGNAARQVLSNPLTTNVDYMIPGYNTKQVGRMSFGPIVGIPMGALATRYPEWGKVKDAMFGEERAASDGIMSQLMPASMMKLYKAAFADVDSDRQLASATIQAMQFLESSGNGLDEDADEIDQERYYDDVRSAARVIMATRGLTGFFGFASASPDLDQGRFSEKFQELLDSGMDYKTALDAFMEAHGAEGLPYTVFKSQNEAGGPLTNTDKGLRWMVEHEDYISEFPLAAAWVTPEDDPEDEFSQRAYAEGMAQKLRRIRKPEEWEAAFYERQAGPAYWKKRDEIKAQLWALKKEKDSMPPEVYSAQKAAIDMDWQGFSSAYKNQHPVWAKSLTPEGAERRMEAIKQLQTMLADPEGPDRERLKPMRDLVEEYLKFQRKKDSLSKESSKRARELRSTIEADFFGWATLHVADHRWLEGVWTSVIRPNLADADGLETDLLKKGAISAAA